MGARAAPAPPGPPPPRRQLTGSPGPAAPPRAAPRSAAGTGRAPGAAPPLRRKKIPIIIIAVIITAVSPGGSRQRGPCDSGGQGPPPGGWRFWLTGAPATLTAVALAAQETNRPPFGARRSRKLARLQVENLPRQCFESNMPHLPAGELEIAIPDLCSRRLLMPNLRTLCSLLPYKEQMKWGLKAREIRSRTELSKRMRLYSRKGNYKKVHVHGYHPHDRQRPMEKPNNS
ncbi:uncharacterized protein LOC142405516 isoform X1 [Mycteria americana]|uniref:uncharacterized protein LOC142405516 isoform X1 n=1 Tax=Mycteria americana TaxID=33587 RepID=UPI003F5877C1